jgi:hypothetical protein
LQCGYKENYFVLGYFTYPSFTACGSFKNFWIRSKYDTVTGRLECAHMCFQIYALYRQQYCSVPVRLVGVMGPREQDSAWKILK